jgi:hypothetical protein
MCVRGAGPHGPAPARSQKTAEGAPVSLASFVKVGFAGEVADGSNLRFGMTSRQLHRSTTIVLSVLMAAIGVALAVEAFTAAGSPFSSRLLLGALFLAAGVGRLYVERRRRRGGS